MTRTGSAPPAIASPAVVEHEAEEEETQDLAAPTPQGLLDELLARTPAERPVPAPAIVGVRTARLVGLQGRRATVTVRGRSEPIVAEVAPEVDPEIIADALANGDSVLVECGLVEGGLGEGGINKSARDHDSSTVCVVGVVQTRRPRAIRLKAAVVHIEGDEEVLLRSGRGAVRVRSDGDIEVVGSRISAASRGLFRIVGRMLRLN